MTLEEARQTLGAKLREEAAALLHQYGGRVVSGALRPGMFGPVYVIDGLGWPLDVITQDTIHEFVDTGTQRSWCKCCDADGMWDRVTATYVAK